MGARIPPLLRHPVAQILVRRRAPCEHCDDCVTIEIWQNVLDAINEVVDGITLEYLVEKQKTKKTCCNKG